MWLTAEVFVPASFGTPTRTVQHDFGIEDETGEDLLTSEFMADEGTTQSVSFTVTAEMAEYYCQVHPTRMRSAVEVGS